MQKLLLWFILPWQHLPFTGVCETHKGEVVAREGSVGGRRHGLLKKDERKHFLNIYSAGLYQNMTMHSVCRLAYRVLQAVVVHVEVGRVCWAADFWDVGGLARQDVFPVDA